MKIREIMNNTVAVIDFGSQFTQLIARKVREIGVYSEILSHKNIKKIKNLKNIKGLIFSGGPHTVNKKNSYRKCLKTNSK